MNKFNQGPEQTPPSENNQENVSVEEAVGFIGMTIQECAALGANDSEIPDLENLMRAVKNKEISPREAKEKAQQIKDSKMDYH